MPRAAIAIFAVFALASPAQAEEMLRVVFDYSKIGKGKSLEAMRANAAPDKSALIIERYERGAPALKIPAAGGTVDFDQRWGLGAKCGKFGADIGQ